MLLFNLTPAPSDAWIGLIILFTSIFFNYLFPLIKKYKAIIKRKICSLVNSFVVINQSLWANAKALIITTAIVKALTLVIRLPIEPFIRPPIIKNNRTYKFGTKYMDVFTKIYSALDRRIYNTKNLLSEDNLDNNPN